MISNYSTNFKFASRAHNNKLKHGEKKSYSGKVSEGSQYDKGFHDIIIVIGYCFDLKKRLFSAMQESRCFRGTLKKHVVPFFHDENNYVNINS